MFKEDCIFCRIANGEIPSAKVYEDDEVLAFLDLAPANRGHVLIVPKRHYTNALDFPCEAAPAICQAVKKVGGALVEALNARGFNVFQNNGPAAGQTVFHIHWHIIPRFENDGLAMWAQGSYPSQEEMNALAEKIAGAVK